MKLKNAHVNQLFILVFTTVLIVFCAFLAIKFIGSLSIDINSRTTDSFIDKIIIDFTDVRNQYNSEKVGSYKVPGLIDKIAFITPSCSLSLSYLYSFQDGYYLVVLDNEEQVIDFREMQEFSVKDGCLEVEDIERVSFVYTNSRNDVKITINN